MNKEPDFFSNITPVNGGLIIITLGTLLLIGAIRRWKWIFDMTGQRDKGFNFLLLLYDLFGDKGLRSFCKRRHVLRSIISKFLSVC